MTKYEVTLPIAGVAYLTVEAESEDEAIQKAMEIVQMDDIAEWEALHKIASGSVLHTSHNEAYAEEARW